MEDAQTYQMFVESFAHVKALETREQTWRRESLHLALRKLSQRSSINDQGALLRQIAQLAPNSILKLPLDGLPFDPALVLDTWRVHYGIALSIDRQAKQLTVKVESTKRHLAWPEGFTPDGRALAVPRRPEATICADGALLRLTPYTHYQTTAQKYAARAVLQMPAGESLQVTMPTGSGKSLLFKMAIRWWRERASISDQKESPCVVVIVPTVALALDQVAAMQEFPELEGSQALTGAMSKSEVDECLRDFVHGRVPILLMNPEMAFGSAHDALLNVCEPLGGKARGASAFLEAIFVDEAHIIASWGRKFRPDFQRLASLTQQLRRTNPKLKKILLSATIDDETRTVLERDYGGAHITSYQARYDIDLFQHKCKDKFEQRTALVAALNRLPKPAIVYTTHIADAQEIYGTLKQQGHEALAVFTGETPDKKREQIIAAWRANEIDVVVATSAFGMGVDKADVRTVLHACFPENASRYFQEVGRAGRDGFSATALCLWTEDNFNAARRSYAQEWLTVERATRRWAWLVERSKNSGGFSAQNALIKLKVDLNESLSDMGEHTGQQNIDWNRTLLNLMHRQGALEVERVDGNYWWLRLCEHQLLDPTSDNLVNCLASRDDERQHALDSLEKLKRAFERSTQGGCLLQQVHRLIDRRVQTQPCGRCQGCVGLQSFGLPQEPQLSQSKWPWPIPEEKRPSQRCDLVHYEGHLEDVIKHTVVPFAQSSFDLCIVPDHLTEKASAWLNHPQLGGGWVSGYTQACEHGVMLHDCASVAFFIESTEPIYPESSALRLIFGEDFTPLRRCVLIAPRGTSWMGKKLNQVADMIYSIDHYDLINTT